MCTFKSLAFHWEGVRVPSSIGVFESVRSVHIDWSTGSYIILTKVQGHILYWLKYRVIYYISTVETQHMQRPDVLLQLGYTWRHVSAVKQPFSGKVRIILLRYSKIFIQWDPIVYIKTWQQFLLYLNNTIISWPEDGPLTAETCHQV